MPWTFGSGWASRMAASRVEPAHVTEVEADTHVVTPAARVVCIGRGGAVLRREETHELELLGELRDFAPQLRTKRRCNFGRVDEAGHGIGGSGPRPRAPAPSGVRAVVTRSGARRWIELRRFPRRIEAEDDADERAERDRDPMTSSWTCIGQWNLPASQAVPTPSATPMRPPAIERTAPRTGTGGGCRRLGADRHAEADLARPLGDADEHDVHDADAADEERHGGDAREQRRHRLGALLLRARDLGEVADREVVVGAGRDVMAIAQERA